jgi:protein-tyrosine-phosphatase
MAEALVNSIGKGKITAVSAGTAPAEQVNPVVVQVMKEIGLDISGNKPKLLTVDLMKKADRVIIMGCGAETACPASFIPTEDWEIEDPEGAPVEQVRQIRNEIKHRVDGLIEEIK